jgi:hypothetical protein
MNSALTRFQLERRDATLARGRRALGADRADKAWDAGSQLDEEGAIELALARL